MSFPIEFKSGHSNKVVDAYLKDLVVHNIFSKLQQHPSSSLTVKHGALFHK